MTIVNGHPNLVKMHLYQKIIFDVVIFVFNVMASNNFLA
jgi:hypothetical protein